MPDKPSHLEQGQAERARRLHDKIEQLKAGRPAKEEPAKTKSIKEQLDERSREQQRSEET